MTSFLKTTDLDFDQLKSALKDYLKQQNIFQDYDFEGSNISVLIDLLSYNTVLNNFYLNMIGSEMFLDSAQLRSSVVSHAKELNYVPRSKTSARVLATIKINPDDNPDTIIIPKYYKIRSELDGVSYTFLSTSDVVVKKTTTGEYITEIEFFEGELVKEVFVANQTRRYVLSSENVDIDSINVIVQNSETDTTTTVWKRADSLYNLGPTDTVFFVEGFGSNQYQIVFGNDIIGKALENGNIVRITYRDTVGTLANNLSNFSPDGTIQGYSDITVTVSSPSYGGANEETIDEIKYLAPRWFQTQERTVTSEDYKVLIKNKFPEIEAVAAYGGEEADPKQYGKVVISLKPYGYEGTVTDILKNEIIQFLKLKNLTTEPVIIDPEFFYLDINTEVQVDLTQTTDSFETIKTNILNRILEYGTKYLNDFDKDLRYSKLISYIDYHQSIVSNDTTVRLVKKWNPELNYTETTTIKFNNKLYKNNELTYAHPLGHEEASIKSGQFTYEDKTTAFIEDDGVGHIRLYYYTNDGTPILINSDIGYVNYETGEVSFTMSVKSYDGQYIPIYATTDKKDIYSNRNNFLIINKENITINVIEYKN